MQYNYVIQPETGQKTVSYNSEMLSTSTVYLLHMQSQWMIKFSHFKLVLLAV